MQLLSLLIMKRIIPSLNWLRVFEAAARLESFARAAENLNMSTSAVSQQVKALESHFGVSLFNRGSRKVELTQVGHAFLPSVRRSLKMVEESAVSLFDQTDNHALTIQATLIFATMWMPQRLDEFSSEFPNIQVHINGSYKDDDFKHAGSDLGVIFGPVSRSWGQCDRLFDEKIYAVGHKDIISSIKSIEDVLQHRLIQVQTHHINWNQMMDSVGIENIPASQLCFTDSTQIALSLAESGYGLALARAPVTDNIVNDFNLEKIDLLPTLSSPEAYYLVYRNLQSLPKPAQAFRNWLLSAVK